MKKLLVLVLALSLAMLVSPARATELNLMESGNTGTLTGTVGGVAYFYQGVQLSGTGVFPAFVQVAGGGSPDVHDAYNTTVNDVLFNGSSDTFNHAIQLTDVSIVPCGAAGASCYEFFLDINEDKNATDRFLSLDDLRVYLSPTANQSVTNPDSLGTAVWKMDPDDVILLDFSLEPGSGRADMGFQIPTTAFNSVNGPYVYLYSKFGSVGTDSFTFGPKTYSGDFGNSDGFEEWAYNLTLVEVPDGGSMVMLLGAALMGLGAFRRFVK